MERAFSPKKGGLLESIHLYRKVPRDLTDATVWRCPFAGLRRHHDLPLSEQHAEYMRMTNDNRCCAGLSGDVHMRLFFNITMERLLVNMQVSTCTTSWAPR